MMLDYPVTIMAKFLLFLPGLKFLIAGFDPQKIGVKMRLRVFGAHLRGNFGANRDFDSLQCVRHRQAQTLVKKIQSDDIFERRAGNK